MLPLKVISLSSALMLAAIPALAQTKAQMQQESRQAQQEIARTRKEIGLNENKIKENLTKLDAIRVDIASSEQTIKKSTQEIGSLNGKIGSLQGQIEQSNDKLKQLRDQYLVALKKIRAAHKRNSELAFLFSSKNFHQGMRRLRYLREFGRWRARQAQKIQAQIEILNGQRTELDKTRSEKNRALASQRQAKTALSLQHKEQDALIMQLRAHGDELRAHLAEKQKEANALKAQIAAIIAEEQRQAAEKAAREKAAREAAEKAAREKAERERAEREAAEKAAAEKAARIAAEKAAAEKAAAEKAARQAAEKKAAEKKAAEKAAKAKANKKAKEEAAKAKREAENAQREAERARKKAEKAEQEKKNADKQAKDYASARGRTSRRHDSSSSTAHSKSSGSGFEAKKGSLPRPASGGAFRIVRNFGRQALPGLPGVEFDNPGIDVEVSAGAKAQAVADGKVSGVYMLPGYNTVVIVSHGNYYTVYGNILSASVKTGDSVKTGHSLGSLAKDSDNEKRTLLHFEVWHGRDKLNPASWLR